MHRREARPPVVGTPSWSVVDVRRTVTSPAGSRQYRAGWTLDGRGPGVIVQGSFSMAATGGKYPSPGFSRTIRGSSTGRRRTDGLWCILHRRRSIDHAGDREQLSWGRPGTPAPTSPGSTVGGAIDGAYGGRAARGPRWAGTDRRTLAWPSTAVPREPTTELVTTRVFRRPRSVSPADPGPNPGAGTHWG